MLDVLQALLRIPSELQLESVNMAKFFFAAIAALVVAAANAQQAGKNTAESPLPFTIQKCTKSGGCQSESGTIVLDSNWRWTHHVSPHPVTPLL